MGHPVPLAFSTSGTTMGQLAQCVKLSHRSNSSIGKKLHGSESLFHESNSQISQKGP